MIDKLILGDIEVYQNAFLLGLKGFHNKEVVLFEIFEEENDLAKIVNFVNKFNKFFVTFNGIHYDNVVLSYIRDNYKTLSQLSSDDCCYQIKRFSDKVIHSEENFDEIKRYRWSKKKWTDIDLFLYWSKSLRISKQISLKSLGIQLQYPVVQELPYKPNTILTKENFEVLKKYNSVHDLGILELLTSKMEEDIKLRAYVKQEYNLSCWSMDAPKIASEYLLDYYCNKTYSFGEEKFSDYRKRIKNTRYYPNEWIVGDYLPEVKFKTEFFKNIYEGIRKSTNNNLYSIDIPFLQPTGHAIMLKISQGGIHSGNDNQQYREDNKYYYIDADIAGLRYSPV